MKKKGFTLVELIAVIAVLGIILSIAVPTISGVINKSRINSFEIDAKVLLKALDQKKLKDRYFDPTTVNENTLKDILGIKNENYGKLTVSLEEDIPVISIVGKNEWDGFIACGTYDNIKVVENSNDCSDDNVPPVITIIGNNPANINMGGSYTDQGATAEDNIDGDITSKITKTSNVAPSIPGSYKITYTVSDSAGNVGSADRTVNVIDNVAPTIAFGTNGNATYGKSRSTTVTVTDVGGVNASSLKYLWNTSTTASAEASFSTTFTNGGTITSPAGVTGGYYLWILAKDTSGNTTISRSNVFNLDNTAPVIAITGNSTITLAKGSSYTDQGATVTDNIDTAISVTSTGTVNTNVVGTYIITYNATDSSGNVAVSKTRTINVVDVSAPVITMLGSNPVTLQCGTAYADAGSTAVDDVDGNVTSRITATSTVNPNLVGTYYVTYTVKDNANNTATATRTVNVVDTIGPSFTSYAVINITSTGYDIYIYGVSDSGSGVNRIQFPTWTDLNGQDDLQPSWPTNSIASGTNLGNGTWHYRVNISAHNNESGQYRTDVYLYDNVGNVSAFATSGAYIPPMYSGPGYIASKGVNGPVLAPGMTPIKWNGSDWISTTTNDIEWYDYSSGSKQWANAMTADGSLWVWIPRYIYRIPTTNWHTNVAGTIDIQFSMGTDDTRGGTVSIVNTGQATDSNGTWTNHPAFTFGTTEITGMWVAKFVSNQTNEFTVASKPNIILYNTMSRQVGTGPAGDCKGCSGTSICDSFVSARRMETDSQYGWGTSGSGIDTHMAKNTEWGAIAYLTQSIYGANSLLAATSTDNAVTGCGGYTSCDNGSCSRKCSYRYNTYPDQSTTKNIYGIYDMIGIMEYTAAHMPVTGGEGDDCSSLYNAEIKYKDVYEYGYGNSYKKKGDAVWETSYPYTSSSSTSGLVEQSYYSNSSWYGDGIGGILYPFATSQFLNFFLHGRTISNSNGYSTDRGSLFAYQNSNSGPYVNAGFRPIILVQSGL